MPPQLATFVCLLLIGYLFWTDRKRMDGLSQAVWIPLLWMFFAGSRYASQWLNLGGPAELTSAEAYGEGSPLDRYVFLALFLSGVWVLSRRRLNWQDLILKNAWIWLFFLFALMSILWSDVPFVALKRWVKGFGNLTMALIILTERRPYEALGFVLTRLGFVLIPVSVLFVRYYPDLGRAFHMGEPMLTGATFSKNSLGQLCLIVGTYLVWELTVKRSQTKAIATRLSPFIHIILLPLTAWLLYVSDSATCIALMVVAVCFLLIARIPWVEKRPRRIVVIGITVMTIAAVLEATVGIKGSIILALGRQPDLTSRTPIWNMLVDMVPRPWIGAGYESFWSGERLIGIWARLGVSEGGIIQAHNGYIETYLNLGIVGLVLLIGCIIVGFFNAIRHLEFEYANAVLRILMIVTVVTYNYTEATYKPVSNMFVLLLFAIVEIRALRSRKQPRADALSAKRQKRQPLRPRGREAGSRVRLANWGASTSLRRA